MKKMFKKRWTDKKTLKKMFKKRWTDKKTLKKMARHKEKQTSEKNTE